MRTITLLSASALLGILSLVACSGSDSGGGTVTDGGGSGTTDETGGGTCTLATTCLGAFLGTCFDPTGTCTAAATSVTYSGGAKMTKTGSTWTATSSKGDTCFTIDDTGGTYTFHVGDKTLTMTTAGNQTRFTCPDGSNVNFTSSAFDNSECARYMPTGAACGKK
jgi:hypothetical protein